MKIIFFALVVLVNVSISFAQQPDVPQGAIQIDESTIIKDTVGNVLPFNQFIALINSGDWTAEPKFNNQGKLEFLQLRKATEEDKKMMANMGGSPIENERIGEAMPTFNLKDTKGKEFNSEELIGKVVVINLWFTTCKPCVMEMPELNQLYSEYKDNSDVVFVSITYNSPKEIKQFLKKHDFDYPIVGSALETCNSFGVKGYPTNIVVDQSGKYAFYATGSFPGIKDVLESEIQKLLVK
jgi:thiol-disulfide isomerase/thioredoxin